MACLIALGFTLLCSRANAVRKSQGHFILLRVDPGQLGGRLDPCVDKWPSPTHQPVEPRLTVGRV